VVLFAVAFLDVALELQSQLEWSLLVIPIAMVATGFVIWLPRTLRRGDPLMQHTGQAARDGPAVSRRPRLDPGLTTRA
jgi:hypothetical protein